MKAGVENVPGGRGIGVFRRDRKVVPLCDGVGPLRVGVDTHLPWPQKADKRPAEAGAEVAASSPGGCSGRSCWCFCTPL